MRPIRALVARPVLVAHQHALLTSATPAFGSDHLET